MLYPLARRALFSLDAERAHHITLSILRKAASLGLANLMSERLPENPLTVMGITFPNPVGLAAGLDKDGNCIDGLATLGFGFIEVGTITPRPQLGNPKPRLFHVPQAHGIINRMGFNNAGIEKFLENIQSTRWKGPLGLNIGKNADTPIENAVDDYLICLEKCYPYANYITINVSSPNTKNLRQLQESKELDSLLGSLKEKQYTLSERHDRYVPIVLKIAPDLEDEQIKLIASLLTRHQVDGVVATNTTISRDSVNHLPIANETGGLSGRPLFDASNRIIRALRAELGDAIPIIGVGGILSGKDARDKLDAGATLVQIYSGLIYRGPVLVRECVEALLKQKALVEL